MALRRSREITASLGLVVGQAAKREEAGGADWSVSLGALDPIKCTHLILTITLVPKIQREAYSKASVLSKL